MRLSDVGDGRHRFWCRPTVNLILERNQPMNELEYAEYMTMIELMIEEDVAALAASELEREGN